MVLRMWTIYFDPKRELVAVRRVWAILPDIPLDFLSKEVLEVICNKLGVFVGLEPNWDSKVDRRWASIHIELDVHEGLIGILDLVYGDHIWHQKTDYWKIPFQCYDCHEIGHV
jgi:hypothetical protein